MWTEKNLPAIPKAQVDENGNEIVEVGSHRKGIVKDSDANVLIQVNDEGTTGAITLPAGSTPVTVTNKLYNVGGTLYWNGIALGTAGGNCGWTDDGTVVRLTTGTDKVGIGDTSTTHTLDVAGKIGINDTQVLYLPDQSDFFGTLYLGDGGGSLSHISGFDGRYNTGIGTSNPGAKLEVAGQVKITGGNPGAGKVLTSDANGMAAWEPVSSGSIPSGVIVMWSGSISNIPSGWVLCDGTNVTPDLKNRFIVGAGDEYAVSSIGGEKIHQLTVDEMPSHTHTGGVTAHHGAAPGSDGNIMSISTTGSSGGGQPHENRPPYYTLAFIMKS